jgi:EAL and modified HD-GYP domain-containing signal transduction protein
MVISFVKRVLGQDQEEVPMSDNPFGDRNAPQEIVSATPAPGANTKAPVSAEADLQLQRDEIIDSRGRIAGYRLRPFKTSGALVGAGEYLRLLADEAVAALARRRLALIPLKLNDWNPGGFAHLAAPGTTYLLDAPLVTPDEQIWASTSKDILDNGAHFALGHKAMPPPAKALLPLAKLFLIDFAAYELPRFEQLVRTLRQHFPELKIAADNVATWPERRLCLSLGIEYCLGGFASTPDEATQREDIDQGRLTLIEMLNLLRRDADLDDLVAVAKRDPGVSLQIVAMANAPVVGLAQPVASMDQAIMVLGRANLYRWLTVSMFRAGKDAEQDNTLLELALSRARFLELTSQAKLDKAQNEELFLVGLLSVMDALLGMPMTKVLEKMHLPPIVQEVLLHSEGPYGPYLSLALALEKGRDEQVGKLTETLALDPALLPTHNLAALAWAEEAMSHSRG